MVTADVPLSELADELREGTVTPTSHIDTCCDRIEAIDTDIQAWLEEPGRRERLHNEAAELADRFPDPNGRPLLYGVLVGVKDIIHVDGFTTRAGTALPPAEFAGEEAPVVTRLRDHGALILGKTATTEFAGFAPALTRNPHNLEHTPGGSSSGSAAAVASGMAPLALGSQTGGSVIRPAAFCGIVGFKPSRGRIPLVGVIPRSKSVDQVGLFTRDVGGMSVAAEACCRPWDPADPADAPVLGIPTGSGYLERASEAGRDAFEDQIATLEDHGFETCRIRAFEDFDAIERWHSDLTGAEIALVHTDWLESYRAFYRTLTAEEVEAGQQVTAKELAVARRGQRILRKDLHGRMDDAAVDLWVCPAAPGPAPEGITSTGDAVMNRPWTFAGTPAITIPAGEIDGLPIGLQLVARFGDDERLLGWAETLANVLSSDSS